MGRMGPNGDQRGDEEDRVAYHVFQTGCGGRYIQHFLPFTLALGHAQLGYLGFNQVQDSDGFAEVTRVREAPVTSDYATSSATSQLTFRLKREALCPTKNEVSKLGDNYRMALLKTLIAISVRLEEEVPFILWHNNKRHSILSLIHI